MGGRLRLILVFSLLIFCGVASWAAQFVVPGGEAAPAPVLRTGITDSFNASGTKVIDGSIKDDGYYQSGVGIDNIDERFTAGTGDHEGTVQDNLTGLIWTKDARLADGGGVYFEWEDALEYVAGMNEGEGTYGYTTWRLPNINEMRSLISVNNANTGFPSGLDDYFDNISQYAVYWTSTRCPVYNTTHVMCIFTSTIESDSDDNVYNVWAVCSPESGDFPAPLPATGASGSSEAGADGSAGNTVGVTVSGDRFVIVDNDTATTSDDTVIDTLTGLEWLRDGDAHKTSEYSTIDLEWAEALDFIGKLNTSAAYANYNAGHTDWRMPNANEMLSIISYGTYAPAVASNSGAVPFVNLDAGSDRYYWTSSIGSYTSRTFASRVNVFSGSMYIGAKENSLYRVLPVRNYTTTTNVTGSVSLVASETAAITDIEDVRTQATTAFLETYGATLASDKYVAGGVAHEFTATFPADATLIAHFTMNVGGIGNGSSTVNELELTKYKGTSTLTYTYDATAAGASGSWYLTEVGTAAALATTVVLDATKNYQVHFFIENNSDYDVDPDNGIIKDPVSLIVGAPVVVPVAPVVPVVPAAAAGSSKFTEPEDYSAQSCELSRGGTVVGMVPLLFSLGLLMLLSRKRKSRD